MDPCNVQDLLSAVLKHQRANISDDMGSNQSTNAPRIEASGCGSNVSDVSKNLVFVKEQVRAFLRIVGDH